MAKRKLSKKHLGEQRHFAMRCVDRIGYVPDQNDLIRKIQNQELEFFGRDSVRITKWKWLEPIYKIPCLLVYDKVRKQVVTILFERIK